jgi:antitoxin YefM
MHSIYRLNVRELDQHFIDGLKATYQDKEIEIVVYEVDETAYLMASQANKKKLLQAVDAVKNKSHLVEVDIESLK